MNSDYYLSDSKPSKWDGLNLNMTAAEMRMRIGSRKKRDPRKDDRMDFRKKFEIIDDLWKSRRWKAYMEPFQKEKKQKGCLFYKEKKNT